MVACKLSLSEETTSDCKAPLGRPYVLEAQSELSILRAPYVKPCQWALHINNRSYYKSVGWGLVGTPDLPSLLERP